MSVGRTRLGKPQPESIILFASLACACSPRSSLFRWRGPPSDNVHLPGGLIFSVQVAWSTFTWLGGRSWRLHLHPPSTRLDYTIGAQSVSIGLNLKQIFAGDFFLQVIWSVSSPSVAGRDGVPTGFAEVSQPVQISPIQQGWIGSHCNLPDVIINDQMQKNIIDTT